MNKFAKYVGLDYSSFECSQLVQLVLDSEFGVMVPDDFNVDSTQWDAVREPIAGDVILFQRSGVVYHCGLMIDAEFFLHADSVNGAVAERLTSDNYWSLHFEGFYRFRGQTL